MSRNTMIQLDPTIPVVTPDGKGEAIGWIDYSKDDDLLWVVFLQANGECWIYPNHQIRAVPNVTTGRMPGVSCKDLSKSITAHVLPGVANGVQNKSAKLHPTAPGSPAFHPVSKKPRPPKKHRVTKSVFHIN